MNAQILTLLLLEVNTVRFSTAENYLHSTLVIYGDLRWSKLLIAIISSYLCVALACGFECNANLLHLKFYVPPHTSVQIGPELSPQRDMNLESSFWSVQLMTANTIHRPPTAAITTTSSSQIHKFGWLGVAVKGSLGSFVADSSIIWKIMDHAISRSASSESSSSQSFFTSHCWGLLSKLGPNKQTARLFPMWSAGKFHVKFSYVLVDQVIVSYVLMISYITISSWLLKEDERSKPSVTFPLIIPDPSDPHLRPLCAIHAVAALRAASGGLCGWISRRILRQIARPRWDEFLWLLPHDDAMTTPRIWP